MRETGLMVDPPQLGGRGARNNGRYFFGVRGKCIRLLTGGRRVIEQVSESRAVLAKFSDGCVLCGVVHAFQESLRCRGPGCRELPLRRKVHQEKCRINAGSRNLGRGFIGYDSRSAALGAKTLGVQSTKRC